MKNKINVTVFGISMLFILIFSFNFVLAEENTTIKEQANICLNTSTSYMVELAEENFNVLRVNASLIKGTNQYESQELLEAKKRSFELVLPYCDEIENIYSDAFEARYSLEALEAFYSDSETKASSIEVLINKIKNEIETERYEKVFPLVDETYEEILRVESEQTALNVFYKSTTQTLTAIMKSNWRWLSWMLGGMLILFLIYRTAIMRIILKKKLKDLNLRKDSLREMIGETQRNYFQNGKISEREYEIRTRNFAEMVRDIDRQIPLIEERLIKYAREKDVHLVKKHKEELKRENKIKGKVAKKEKKDFKKNISVKMKQDKKVILDTFKTHKKNKKNLKIAEKKINRKIKKGKKMALKDAKKNKKVEKKNKKVFKKEIKKQKSKDKKMAKKTPKEKPKKSVKVKKVKIKRKLVRKK